MKAVLALAAAAAVVQAVHYEKPPCGSDEIAGNIKGANGTLCAPKCDAQGKCPMDVPKGTWHRNTTTPACILSDQTGQKYCALTCVLVGCPTGAHCAMLAIVKGVCVYPNGTQTDALPAPATNLVMKPPSWLEKAGLGFLEGFTKTQDLDGCVMAALGPVSDITDGISDIQKGIKDRNVTDIEEGVASLRKVMEDMPAAMQGCKMEEEDVQAIMKVLKGFHSLKDIIGHVKADLKADEKGEIAAQLELMVRSFKEKQYQDFGKHAGQLLHRLFVGPSEEKGAIVV